MHLHFSEPPHLWQQMLPLSYTRPVADLRVGILTIAEKWQKYLGSSQVSFGSQPYLSALFPSDSPSDALYIHSAVLPTPGLAKLVKALKPGEALYAGEVWIATSGEEQKRLSYADPLSIVSYPWDLFRLNKQEIELDFDLLTIGRTSQPINDPHTFTYGSRIFLEEGASVKAAVLNAETGAIYLGKNSEVQEGSVIRGSFALGEGSVVNMGAKMRGDSTIGPHCKVGGEISNSILHSHSNKAHDGFLGNSVIGEWCNLGADTNNSNLKNNYAPVKMWDFASGRFKDTGLQFCGLIMGDHSKCGINTMFNTGTTVGVSANIFGEGFPRNIIPSFAWGGASGFSTYQMRQVYETVELVMKRRNKTFGEPDKALLQHIFELTADQRAWEKKQP